MDSSTLEMMLQLGLAFVLGATLGIEREVQSKPAGLRTYTLVCIGSCLFTIISIMGFSGIAGAGVTFDPSRVAAQIVSGIGFIGAGLIFFRNDGVQGLTTAAGLWIAAAIGMAIGVRLYAIAAFAAVLSVLILHVLAWFERCFIKTKPE